MDEYGKRRLTAEVPRYGAWDVSIVLLVETMNWRAALALALTFGSAACAHAGPPPAAGPQPLNTGLSNFVQGRPGPGVESLMPMPPDSSYAQAIALDIKGRFSESYEVYRKARDQLVSVRVHEVRPGDADGAPAMIAWERRAVWERKSDRQMKASGTLASPSPPNIGSSEAFAICGDRLVLKFLAARAFTGHAPMALARRARVCLEGALRQDPNDVRARLTLAQLLHEMGDSTRARQEFGRLRLSPEQRSDEAIVFRLAAYHAAAGDNDVALQLLEPVLRKPFLTYFDYFLESNYFDRLLDDPRFRQMLPARQRSWSSSAGGT